MSIFGRCTPNSTKGFLSAAIGRRPRNFSSCFCGCCSYSRFFHFSQFLFSEINLKFETRIIELFEVYKHGAHGVAGELSDNIFPFIGHLISDHLLFSLEVLLLSERGRWHLHLYDVILPEVTFRLGSELFRHARGAIEILGRLSFQRLILRWTLRL